MVEEADRLGRGRAVVLAPGNWGRLLLKETAAAGSFSPSCPPAMMAHGGAELCGTWLQSAAGDRGAGSVAVEPALQVPRLTTASQAD